MWLCVYCTFSMRALAFLAPGQCCHRGKLCVLCCSQHTMQEMTKKSVSRNSHHFRVLILSTWRVPQNLTWLRTTLMSTSDIIVCTLEIICSVTYEVEWVMSLSWHSGQWWSIRGAVWTHFHSSELKIANAHGAPGLPIGSSHAGRCVLAFPSKEYFFDSLLSPPYHPLFSLLCSICILWNDILFTKSSTRLTPNWTSASKDKEHGLFWCSLSFDPV
jgi:hypothetical protein